MTDFGFLTNSGWLFVYGWSLRAVLAGVVVLFGMWGARQVVTVLRRMAGVVGAQKGVQDSPLSFFFDSLTHMRGTGLATTLVFWSITLFFVALAGEVLGFTFFSQLLAILVGYIPSLLSALIIFIVGVFLAGVVERVVKQQSRRYAPHQAVLIGTLASSITLVLFFLMAISELGIASDFILIAFAGVVFAAALAVGIAVGFGARELVSASLQSLVVEEKSRREKSNK